MIPAEPQSWHHGLVARWWSLFRRAGPEIAYFRQFVEAGQPALDVACGAGRLLVPYVEVGLDVDGCDASADMVSLCRQAAAAVNASPNLYCQPMHDLDLPRRYRTIYVCGGLGLGSTREQDEQALRRLYKHLEPGGRLVLDNEVPYSDATHWALWPDGTRGALPEPTRPPGHRQLGPDGYEYALQSRMLGLDPLLQQVAHEIDAYQWRDGSLIAQERHQLTSNLYFCGELVMMLERAGFRGRGPRGVQRSPANSGRHVPHLRRLARVSPHRCSPPATWQAVHHPRERNRVGRSSADRSMRSGPWGACAPPRSRALRARG